MKKLLLGLLAATALATTAHAQILNGVPTPTTTKAGGTGAVLTPVIGDLLCASSTTAFGRLAGVATGSVLVSGGVGACPSYSSSLPGGPYLPLAGGTMLGDLLATDGLYDIGKLGATRFRNLFMSGTGTFGGVLTSTVASGQVAVSMVDGARLDITGENVTYITEGGGLVIQGGTTGTDRAILFKIRGSEVARFAAGTGNLFSFVSTGNLGWNSDANISRISAGIVGFGTGAQGSIAGGIQAATGAFGGATIGSDTIAATGSIKASTSIKAGTFLEAAAGSYVHWNGRGAMYSPSDGVINLQNDAGTSFTRLQFGGTSSSFGAFCTTGISITSCLADGTGGANFNVSGGMYNSGILSDATHTDASVCEDTTTHLFYSGSGTLGICLGTSSARYKHGIQPLVPGLAEVLKLTPVSYHLNADHGDPTKLFYGFTAESMRPVVPVLVGNDVDGKPNTADLVGLIPVLVKAVQQEQAEIVMLKARVAKLEKAQARR